MTLFCCPNTVTVSEGPCTVVIMNYVTATVLCIHSVTPIWKFHGLNYFRPSSDRFVELYSWKRSSSLSGYSVLVVANNRVEVIKSDFLIDSMKYGGDVSGPSPIWPKLGQLTRFGLKTCWKPIFLSFITVKVDLELKNCENVKKFQKRFGP